MVRIHAVTIFRPTPHLTADILRAAPTPMEGCSVDAFFRKMPSLQWLSRGLERPPIEVSTFVEDAMKQKGKIAVGLSFIAESIDRLGGYSSDIAEIDINLAQ